MKESAVIQCHTKGQPAAQLECKKGRSCVLYKNKEYVSATEALQAYVLDYEKKQQKYYSKSKYDKEIQDLFCPKTKTENSSWVDHGKAETDSSIARIVRESYDRLEKVNREAGRVNSSVSASMKLMRMLEEDRLPSPTRNMRPGGRPSTESADTETLLDATVTAVHDFHIANSQDLSLHKSSTQHPSFLPSKSATQSYNRNSDHAKGLDFSSSDGFSRGYSRSITGDKHMGVNASLNSSKMDYSGSHGISSENSVRNKDGCLSSGNERQTQYHGERTGSTLVDGTLQSVNRLDERVNRSLHSSDLKREDRHSGSRNTSAQNLSKLSVGSKVLPTDEMLGAALPGIRIKSGTSATEILTEGNKMARVKEKTKKHGFGKNLQGSYLDLASGAESDGATSSIITGHMMKGALPHKSGLTKLSSTPKREHTGSQGTKQLRFVDLETSKSSRGQGLELNDLLARQSKQTESPELEASFDVSKVQTATPVKTDMLDRRGNVGILKTFSPGKSRGTMSRVSFTTDDLLTCDPSGCTPTHRKPRSNSLPRPSSSHQIELEKSDMHTLRNPFERTRDDLDPSLNGSGRSQQKGNNVSYARRSDTSLQEIKEAKYKEFLRGLLRDIDDSASSVTTFGEGLQRLPDTPTAATELAYPNAGGGYLERIQKLLSGVPSVSEYLRSDNSQDSLTTEAILEGDRPWENPPSFKPPQSVPSSTCGPDTPTKNMFADFMADCMAESEGAGDQATRTAQPLGSLEALKNMLFTVQNLGTAVKHTESPLGSQPASEEGSVTGDVADLNLNDSISKLLSPETKRLLSNSYAQGAPSLSKAMEHLTKLKDLVHHSPEDMGTTEENQTIADNEFI